MKKKDWYVIMAGILAAAAAWFIINRPVKEPGSSMVVIYKDGREYERLPLGRNDTVTLKGDNGSVNVVRIQDGKAEMLEANCPDQICVHTRPAEKDGQSVICLPNRVVIEIKSTEKESIDGVSE